MRCQLKDACLGGAESPCSEDYQGLRCGECSEERYLWGGSCSPCGAYSVVIVLFVILIVIAVIVLLFFLWQVLLNPLVGSPFIFAMRLAETLAILGQSSLQWPSQVISGLRYTPPRLDVPHPFPGMHLLLLPFQVKDFLSVLAIVNFNTDMFRLPCLLGSSQPISKALFTAASPFVASACGLVILPLITKLCSRYHEKPAGQLATLEELCALSNKGEGHFGPRVAYAVATRTEAALIFFVVSATLRQGTRPGVYRVSEWAGHFQNLHRRLSYVVLPSALARSLVLMARASRIAATLVGAPHLLDFSWVVTKPRTAARSWRRTLASIATKFRADWPLVQH